MSDGMDFTDRVAEAARVREREALRAAGRRSLPCGHIGDLVPAATVGHGGRRWECVVCDQWWRESLSGGLVRSLEVPR